jgi:hypothetical protein
MEKLPMFEPETPTEMLPLLPGLIVSTCVKIAAFTLLMPNASNSSVTMALKINENLLIRVISGTLKTSSLIMST